MAALEKSKREKERNEGLIFKIPGLEDIRKQLPGYKEFCKDRAEKRKEAKKVNDNVEG